MPKVLNWGQISSQGTVVCPETFLIIMTGGHAAGIWWVRAKDTAKHVSLHSTALTTKNDLAPKVNSAEVEKP